MQSNSDEPTAAEVREALANLLASKTFKASKQMRGLLTYLVEQKLNGNERLLTGYSLGLDFFRRGDGFDMREDPIVQVVVSKIRDALAAYYDGQGRDDSLKIAIPWRTYNPVFVAAGVPYPVQRKNKGKTVPRREKRNKKPEKQQPSPISMHPYRTIIIQDHSPVSNIELKLIGDLVLDALLPKLSLANLDVQRFKIPESLLTHQERFTPPRKTCLLDTAISTSPGCNRLSWLLRDLDTNKGIAEGMFEFPSEARLASHVEEFSASSARAVAVALERAASSSEGVMRL